MSRRPPSAALSARSRCRLAEREQFTLEISSEIVQDALHFVRRQVRLRSSRRGPASRQQKAFDGSMTAAHKAMGSLEDQTAAAQAGAKDVGRKAVPFAEQTCPVARFPPKCGRWPSRASFRPWK